MRVGIVTTSFPRSPGEYAGSFVAEHAAWLAAAGHEVDVIAAGDDERSEAWAPGIQVRRVPAPPGLFYAGGAPEALDRTRAMWPGATVFAARLVRAVARHGTRWGAAFAHWIAPSALAVIAADVPTVAIAHSGDVHLARRTGAAAPLAWLLRRRGVELSFVSEPLRRMLATAPGITSSLRFWIESMPIVPMGIDATRLRRARSAASTTRPRTVVFLGRLVPIKGVAVLIDAARHLPPDVRVVIAGAGPERATLERLARPAPNVALIGEVRGERRDRLLACADVVVIPSVELEDGRTEGAPLVAYEAMAAGAAVVASEVGGLATLPRDAVRLVPPRQPLALAREITALLADGPARTSQIAAADRVATARDWRVVGPTLCEPLKIFH
jgi:glycosyltransferase involved in cell wall biosynthesis